MLGISPTYRTVVAFDIERSGGRGDQALRHNRKTLASITEAALAKADIAWSECHRTDQGDGLRLVLGHDVPKYALLHPALPELAAGLRAHNRLAGPGAALRIRMAVHAGDVHMDEGEVVGAPLEILARLLDADPLRQALAKAPQTATVALAVSEHVYGEVVRHGYPGVDPATYWRTKFQVKETQGYLWLHIVGHAGMGEIEKDASSFTGRKKGRSRAATPLGPQIRLVAKDRATVRDQIGMIGTRIDHNRGGGPVAEESNADEILGLLDEIREMLENERLAGRVDEVTCAAAEDELQAADAYVTSPGEPGRGRLMVSLKRLKGLVEDLADVSAKVAAVITSVRGH